MNIETLGGTTLHTWTGNMFEFYLSNKKHIYSIFGNTFSQQLKKKKIIRRQNRMKQRQNEEKKREM